MTGGCIRSGTSRNMSPKRGYARMALKSTLELKPLPCLDSPSASAEAGIPKA